MFGRSNKKKTKELSQTSVLVVDGHSRSRELISRLLTRIHIGRGLTATSAEDALYNLEQDPKIADIIITDSKLAGMSGLKFLKKLRGYEDPNIRLKPVIGVSRTSDMKLYRSLASYGISGFIVKPIGEHRLREALEQALAGYLAPAPSLHLPELE
ncbi:MAG: response regulator [Alphaproteobacteria bacterium]|nr:response regulator [Alphaproteobacteria bacterium]